MASTSSSNPSLIPAQLPPADTSVEDTGAGAGNSGGLPPGSDVPAHESRDSNVDDNDNNTSSSGKDAKVDNLETIDATPHDIQESSKQPSHDSQSKGNDVPPAQDTSGASSETTRPIGGLITLDQSLKLAMTGILPNKDGSNTADDSGKTPSRYVLPTPRGLDENTFLVGVPAHPAAYRTGANVKDGYGGTKAMMVFDGLTNQDLDDLGRMLGNHVEVREMTLRPYVEREPPSVVNLKITLNSLSMRREMASILTQFPCGRFAERLFYTVSLLHRVLEYHRSQVSTQKISDQEAAAVRTEMETIKANLESDFGSMAEERAALESRLNDRIQKLEGQLEDANRTISRLKQDNRSALDADKLMAFLNEHGNNIRELCDVMKDSLNAHETIEIEDSDEKDDPDDEDYTDDADADNDETPKPKTKSSSKWARPLSTSSSDASTDYSSKPPRTPSKRLRPSQPGSSAKSKGSSSGAERTESPLAMKKYRELSKSELAEIEIPARGVVSWRRRGILTQFSPVKDVAEKQTPGFPDYAPQMTEIMYLQGRWMPMEKS
ncbi:Hypothetical protein PHPALM_9337 [Phytophthora palmivora]|uniref:Uncharacterized protein n=1 Tax=Phytophthora palmivora TaxID=4796 RepID=A0A2P4Y7J7_9STRA|nr:Hypothetical protein PHPALM_9337 [Phytophthora palmivora]